MHITALSLPLFAAIAADVATASCVSEGQRGQGHKSWAQKGQLQSSQDPGNAVQSTFVQTNAVQTPAVQTPAVQTPAVQTPAAETDALQSNAAPMSDPVDADPTDAAQTDEAQTSDAPAKADPTSAVLTSVVQKAAAQTNAAQTNAAQAKEVQKSGCLYNVPDVGAFNTHLQADFSTLSQLPSFLQVSTDTIGPGGDPYSHIFQKENVQVGGGALSLIVKPSTKSPIPSAEIATKDKYLYGSVRTVAKVSSPPGTCNGIFFYKNDNLEIDIEILTHDMTNIWYTNQALVPGNPSTHNEIKQKVDVSLDYHEYRIDWLPGATKFYFDGELQTTLNKNVPATATAFIWNNWASGGEWTGTIPTAEGAMKIRSIDAYLNNTALTC